MLSVKNISLSLGDLAIRNVSFDVLPGQYFVLLGASGAGKSVLLEIIAGLVQPDSGQLFLDGMDITNEKIQKRKIAMVFQSSTLFPHMTVFDNIAYPLRCSNTRHLLRRRIAELADDFAIEPLLNRKPITLSGGESQRVCLARAVASEPKCLLLDEPISSLDVSSRTQMCSLLRRIVTKNNLKIIHVTHDYSEAVSLGSHIAVLENGQIAQTGTVDEVFQKPKSEFIAQFVGIKNGGSFGQ